VDVGTPYPARFDFVLFRDFVACLDARAAVEAAVGLFIVVGGPVGIRGNLGPFFVGYGPSLLGRRAGGGKSAEALVAFLRRGESSKFHFSSEWQSGEHHCGGGSRGALESWRRHLPGSIGPSCWLEALVLLEKLHARLIRENQKSGGLVEVMQCGGCQKLQKSHPSLSPIKSQDHHTNRNLQPSAKPIPPNSTNHVNSMNTPPPPDRPPASLLSITLASAILAALVGYFIGTGSSLGLFSSNPSPSTSNKKSQKAGSKKSWPNSYDVDIHPDSSDEELMTHLKGRVGEVKDSEDEDENEDEDSGGGGEGEMGELKAFEGSREECKLVLVVRTDLGMGKGVPLYATCFHRPLLILVGKIAAQASHAALACYKHFLARSPSSPLLKRWEHQGQAKIAVQAHSEEELEELQAKAISLGLCARVIHDAGRTQIASGTATVLGVGPGPKSVVDGVTGGLKLL